MRKRVSALLAATVILFGGIGARLFYLSQSALQSVSTQQSSRMQTMAVSRGTIYDRYLQPLVNDSTHIVASVSPLEVSLQAVGSALTVEEARALFETLSEGERALLSLSSALPAAQGITQVEAPVRYGSDALARHVVGYVNGEGIGVTGIEKGYNDILALYKGEAAVAYQIDALGRVSMDTQDTLSNTLDACKGGVVLTIDSQIQRLAQAASEDYLDRGAVLIADAETGDILASVSLPLYDQNDVASVLENADSPLLDRTLINYNCGSVFKIITAAAALENGRSIRSTYTCTGSYMVDGIEFHCHNTTGDGAQTMDEAMANSCNCYFIQLALDVGAEAIYDMAERAGFSQALLPAEGCSTSVAILPSRFDLSVDAALANFAIGQGDLLSSAYHLNALLCAVANDGVWRSPSLYIGEITADGTLLKAETEQHEVRLFSAKTARKLQEMLILVVEEGTGRKAAPDIGAAAGKTSTAETGWEVNGEEVVQSWFSGYYPAHDPQYVITILSENGGSNGRPAAPLFAVICDRLFQSGLVENAQDLY